MRIEGATYQLTARALPEPSCLSVRCPTFKTGHVAKCRKPSDCSAGMDWTGPTTRAPSRPLPP